MNKKLLDLFFAMLFLNFTNAQNTFPKDLDFEGLKGHPKQIIETSEIIDLKRNLKDVFYFDESGNLTKIEHFNWYEKDSTYLGDITYYKKLNAKSKIAITLKHKSKDTIRLKKYNLVNDTTINVVINEYKNDFKTEVLQQLDKKNRIIKTVSKITDTLKNAIIANSKTEFIYEDNQLKKLLVKNDKTSEKSIPVVIANAKKDTFGNFVYREYIDENNVVVYKVRREYRYY